MSLGDRHERVGDLFRGALELPEAERDEFLSGECGEDRSLLEEVRELLAADAGGGPIDSVTGAAPGETAGEPRVRPHEEGSGRHESFFGRARKRPVPTLAGVGPGTRIADFELVELLGQGGMGQVWAAEQQSLERRVALKLCLPQRVSEGALAFFAREARAAGRLSHPGIVVVHDHGTDRGLAWIAMELVEGAWTLRDYLDEAARQEDLSADYFRRAGAFIAEVADAMQESHDSGVIHRDLKPQNILVTSEDRPKISDFGLARITDETAISRTGEFAGTYAYMSPEQVTARRMGIDHRTDVFSVGVMLYEMLALRRPFDGDTAAQVAEQIVTKDPPDPRSIRSRVPLDLAVIAGKCLEKDRDRRYQKMAELAADIRRYLANEPIVARPPTAWQRAVKWVKRHPTPSVAAGVGTAAVVVISFLLAANIRAKGTITTERNNLAKANEELAERMRLSALQDYDELMAEVDELWPPHPETIEAYEEWIEKARALVDDLPLHYAKRDELRAGALVPTVEERAAARESHPDYPRLQALQVEIASRRRALLERRDGVRSEPARADWGSLPTDADGLDELASPLVDPEREVFGREAEGLVLARRALELAQAAMDDAQVARVGNTVSRALHAVGRDEEALEAIREALAVAPDEEREEYEGYLSNLEGRVKRARSEDGVRGSEEELARLEAEREGLETVVSERWVWDFPDSGEGRETSWWHANLTRLVESLEGLRDPDTGLLSEAHDAVSAEHGWSVPRRLALAERLRDGLAAGGEWQEPWREAIAEIRLHPAYGGLVLPPQVGLVPIGPDPDSRLWEFWHVATGEEPVRDENGRLVLSEEMGLVLVLIPGGTFWMGATNRRDGTHNLDPAAQADEGPVHEVTLSPYFLSKYEMTQGQWSRFSGLNPSSFRSPEDLAPSLLHPVEQVSWSDCMRELPRLGLALPSEAQWERGCRAGTETPWWTGPERGSLREKNAANLADQAAARSGAAWTGIKDWPELDDGYAVHAPVGTYAANGLGLHGVHGNVWERCLDGYDSGFYSIGHKSDPVAPWEGAATRVFRGGCFYDTAAIARSASRFDDVPSSATDAIGVRPAGAVEP